MAPLFSVGIVTNRFFVEAVPETEQLNHVFGCLLENNQAIYAPCVEPEAIASIEYKFCEEFEDADDHLVIVMKGIKCAFNYRAQVLWV